MAEDAYNKLAAELKASHPEEWADFEKVLAEFRSKYGVTNAFTALYFYQRGMQAVTKLIEEMRDLLKNDL